MKSCAGNWKGSQMADDLRDTGVPDALMESLEISGPQEEAADFLKAIGLPPNQDAIDQLARVFTPCLIIMCERDHAGDGSTWRRSGWKAQLHEIFKKADRLRYRCWARSKEDNDSPFDMINYLGFFIRGRADQINAWAEWGPPGE